MTTPKYPSADEVRGGMRLLKVAWGDVEVLMRAQIAQALFRKPIHERHKILLAMVVALGSLRDACDAYMLVLGVDRVAGVQPIIEGEDHGSPE
jgi:hypothetical protein